MARAQLWPNTDVVFSVSLLLCHTKQERLLGAEATPECPVIMNTTLGYILYMPYLPIIEYSEHVL